MIVVEKRTNIRTPVDYKTNGHKSSGFSAADAVQRASRLADDSAQLFAPILDVEAAKLVV